MAYGKVRVDQVQSSTRTVDVDSLATTAVATQSVAGLLSATDKTKLDGVATGAEVNVNADWSAGSGDAQILNKPTLGTAAAKNTGTAAGNVVELDGSARLPAVDGSQLTGINAATDLTYTAATRLLASSTGTDATLTLVTSTDAGLAPASGGGTTNFLRADGTWAAAGSPPAGSNTQIQFNDGGAFGGDADLTWNKTTNVMTVTGDVNLSDGGTYTTTLQTITPTAARTISFPDATGTVGLVGGSSGNLVVNQSGAYAGVANSSVDNATGNITLGSRFISSLNGAASAPPGAFTGTWFTGGTATTTKPQVVIEPTGTTSTGWSTSGTGLGVNAASGFAGNLLDLQVNGSRKFNAQADGTFQITNSATRFVNVSSTSTLTARYDDNSIIRSFNLTNKGTAADGNGAGIAFESNAVLSAAVDALRQGGADNTALVFSTRAGSGSSLTEAFRLTPARLAAFGGITSSFPALKRNSAVLETKLADDSAYAQHAASVFQAATAHTVATLPGTPAVGMVARVTDATAPAVGVTVTGGGAAAALCWYNGANWSVIGV